MGWVWSLLALGFTTALFWAGARWVVGGGRKGAQVTNEGNGTNGQDEAEIGRRDLDVKIGHGLMSSEVDLWPERTGARTRKELGAKGAIDHTFSGDRAEKKRALFTTGAMQSDSASPPVEPGIRREVRSGPHIQEPSNQAELAPEDSLGEDRPSNRNIAPDQPPTQWHPREHGVPGDHFRAGDHRSATAPEQHSSATDPYAHAPVPGPNHIPQEGGTPLPPRVQP